MKKTIERSSGRILKLSLPKTMRGCAQKLPLSQLVERALMPTMRTKLTTTPLGRQISHMCRIVQAILIVATVFGVFAVSAAAGNEVLTTTAEIRALASSQAALKIPVLVTGVVTVASSCWNGEFFVHDTTGGVFVEDTNAPGPVPGDLVQVSGVSNPGGYTPDIISPHWKKLGRAPLPKVRAVSIQRLMSGAEDGERVEVYGVVKSAKSDGAQLALELESDGYRFEAYPPYSKNFDPNFLVGTTVRVIGTAASSYDSHRHFLTAVIYMPQEPDEPDFSIDQYPARAASNSVLTVAAEILSLTVKQAREAIPLSVTGVVTVAEPNWKAGFIIQDATGGVYVDNRHYPQPQVGDLVQVWGFSSPGGYAPDIRPSGWRKLGTAPLPPAVPVSVEEFMSGAVDGERVQLSGVVRSAQASQIEKSRIRVEVESGGFRFRAFPPRSTSLDPASLVGATVRVRGTAAASFNPSLRDMLTVVMFVPEDTDFIVDQLPDPAISEAPLTSLNRIAQYRRRYSPDARIRVQGFVTYQRPGQDIFLHDKTGGLRVESRDTNVFAPGEIVEAIGFPGVEQFLPVLEDAILNRVGNSEELIVPKKTSIEDLFRGVHQADLISLTGKLLDRSVRFSMANSQTNAEKENVLTLKSDRNFFTVESPAAGPFAKLASIPIGSTLEVQGICLLETGENGEIEAVRVMPLNPGSIHILRMPSWWTARRLLIALGVLLAVSLLGTFWAVVIYRKNTDLKLSIEETLKAQEELQTAHDQLETRVGERTRELKIEMSARKEAEIQNKAILSERMRLAQELHDTLLQGFTGIGLKLDAVTSTLPPSLSATKEQIQKILRQSDEYLREARRSVWQLRSPSLQTPAGFPEALKTVSERALQGTDIALRFTTRGDEYKLPPRIEDNFLRICEEAVTNAAKHASPAEVEVILEYTPEELRLRIRDNGNGFDPCGLDGSKDGHFGLVGIRERVKGVAGNLSLNSQPGKGTELLIAVNGMDKSSL